MPSEANSRVVSGFLDYLRIEKGLASLTISAYTNDIGQFAEFLEERKRVLNNARREDVKDFIQQLFGKCSGRAFRWTEAFRVAASVQIFAAG